VIHPPCFAIAIAIAIAIAYAIVFQFSPSCEIEKKKSAVSYWLGIAIDYPRTHPVHSQLALLFSAILQFHRLVIEVLLGFVELVSEIG